MTAYGCGPSRLARIGSRPPRGGEYSWFRNVHPDRHAIFYELMKRFKEKTGCGVIINTSFNIRGEPIVCTPADAYKCFMGTDMDVLVLENQLLYKDEQPDTTGVDVEAYKASFELD